MKGYTVYVLTQHYYNYWSNHSPQAVANLTNILKTYADIPFDGVGLDEYANLPIIPAWELKNGDVFRERSYSLAMDSVFKANTGLAAIKIDAKNNIEKLAATGFSSLQKNSKTIFALDKPADVFIEVKNKKIYITIAGNENETRIITNEILN
ncbi:hypothetical protein OCK74_26110 [Chitinophagaceae bacterium LB-8]|uniref:Uncharacterized protein n=1 Tax=Paraflavisolibacter caeni TaxID=2982496 RepID=A0A9X3BAE0_9BACT|nr:hypothetical protein [Paraflavisolibacter caeni]MCU7552621.1 hypothetical protein [Paraflavisolibacter caeni]